MPNNIIDLNEGEGVNPSPINPYDWLEHKVRYSFSGTRSDNSSEESIKKAYAERLERERLSKVKLMNNFGITEAEVDILLQNKNIESVLGKIPTDLAYSAFPVNIFVSNGDSVGLVLGYLYDGEYITDSAKMWNLADAEVDKIYPEGSQARLMHPFKKLKDAIFMSSDNASQIMNVLRESIKPVVLVIKNGEKSKITIDSKYTTKYLYRQLGQQSTVAILSKALKVRIKSAQMSIKIYGNAKLKNDLVGTVHSDYTITSNKSKKLEGNTIYNITLNINGNEVKFLLNDIEFVIPSLQGYNFPKDRSLKLGTKVRLTREVSPVLPKGLEGEITRFVKINANSKRVKNSKTRQLDVIAINVDGRIHKVYAKYLKPVC